MGRDQYLWAVSTRDFTVRVCSENGVLIRKVKPLWLLLKILLLTHTHTHTHTHRHTFCHMSLCVDESVGEDHSSSSSPQTNDWCTSWLRVWVQEGENWSQRTTSGITLLRITQLLQQSRPEQLHILQTEGTLAELKTTPQVKNMERIHQSADTPTVL